MKSSLWLLIPAMLLCSACGSSAPSATPTPTQAPVCRGEVCIRAAYLYLDATADSLRVEFSLVDPAGQVLVGDPPHFTGELRLALYRPSDDKYLIGASIPESGYVCYSGNDIPWAGGVFASACGVVLPASQLQVRPTVGDVYRVETIEFASSHEATVMAEH